MTTSNAYDLIVIGFGKAGKTLADKVAAAGYRVAVIEKDAGMYGGTCINVGCLPTKSLVHRAKAASSAARFGISGIDAARYYADAIAEKDRMTTLLRGKNYHKLADRENITVFDGTASFQDAHHVRVVAAAGSEQMLKGTVIVINTGAKARALKAPGFEDTAHIHDSTSVLNLKTLPQHLGIIGGGYIGLEFSNYFRYFGAEVTVLEGAERFLPREDEEDAAAIRQRLEALGVRFILGAAIDRVEHLDDRAGTPLRLHYSVTEDGQKKSHSLELSEILVGIGRVPNVEGLALDQAGVALGERGEVKVNEALVTSVPHIFAVGDVKGGPQFTFISLDDFRIVLPQVLAILEGKTAKAPHTTASRPVFPNTTFIDPPYSRIGLSEQEARARYPQLIVKKMPAMAVPKAHVVEETAGYLKVMIDGDTDQILGAVLFSNESHEMINLFTLAINERIPAKRLGELIYNHPVMAEALNELLA